MMFQDVIEALGLIVTIGVLLGTAVYRLGRLASRIDLMEQRLGRVEQKLDRNLRRRRRDGENEPAL